MLSVDKTYSWFMLWVSCGLQWNLRVGDGKYVNTVLLNYGRWSKPSNRRLLVQDFPEKIGLVYLLTGNQRYAEIKLKYHIPHSSVFLRAGGRLFYGRLFWPTGRRLSRPAILPFGRPTLADKSRPRPPALVFLLHYCEVWRRVDCCD